MNTQAGSDDEEDAELIIDDSSTPDNLSRKPTSSTISAESAEDERRRSEHRISQLQKKLDDVQLRLDQTTHENKQLHRKLEKEQEHSRELEKEVNSMRTSGGANNGVSRLAAQLSSSPGAAAVSGRSFSNYVPPSDADLEFHGAPSSGKKPRNRSGLEEPLLELQPVQEKSALQKCAACCTIL